MAATLDAAILYWRWLGEELPRYARTVTAELTTLRSRPVGAREAALRLARLTQEFTDVLGDLPRRLLAQLERMPADRDGPARRRRHGRVID